MNETLKGVAHIGAELAAVKADLQREMERHRKTWRQLEQVTGLLRECLDEGSIDHVMGSDWVERAEAALSQQPEPSQSNAACDWCAGAGHDFYGDKCIYCKAEPAPAQDERTAFEAWVMQHNTAVREDYDDTDENAPEDIRLDRQGGVYIWANAEAAWFAWKARSALDTRPAQTEQQPEQEPFWYAVVSEQAPSINSAIRRLDVAQEFADSKRERWPDTRVVPLYAAPIAQTAPQPEKSGRYTCIRKGGEYELIGRATTAGSLKMTGRFADEVIVYRDVISGDLYCRTPGNFRLRMGRTTPSPAMDAKEE